MSAGPESRAVALMNSPPRTFVRLVRPRIGLVLLKLPATTDNRHAQRSRNSRHGVPLAAQLEVKRAATRKPAAGAPHAGCPSSSRTPKWGSRSRGRGREKRVEQVAVSAGAGVGVRSREDSGGSGRSHYLTEPSPWRPGGPLRRLAALVKKIGATRIPIQATENKTHIVALSPCPSLPACQAAESPPKKPIMANRCSR